MSEWRTTTTGDLLHEGVIEIGDGYRAKNAEFVERGGLPFVRVGDIGATIRLDGLDELPRERAVSYGSKVSMPDDSLITMKGTVGRVAYVSANHRDFVYSPQISYWRSRDTKQVFPRWLRYWLESPEFLSQAVATKGATDMADYINLRDQRRMRITLPPLPVQARIAAVLGSIDDLIENNRRRIELLEEMAQAIYREWFVHFRYPGHEDVPPVDSQVGFIPQGWRVASLFDVADVAFGFSFKSKRFAESGPFPVIRIRDIPAGVTRTFTDEDSDERYRVRDGDVLIGMDGDFHLQQWRGGNAWLNQRVARLRPLQDLSARHLMLALQGPIEKWNSAISGTTVAHLGKRHLQQIRLVIPAPDVLTEASAAFSGAADGARTLEQSSRKLAAIRGVLLPKLVTGQIDVSTLDLDPLLESVA